MGGEEGTDEAKLLLGGEEEGVAAVLWGLVAWVGRMLREEDRGTATCTTWGRCWEEWAWTG